MDRHQLLEPVAKDKFEVEDRRSRGAEFTRDAAGRVNGVMIKGMDGEGLTLPGRCLRQTN